MRITAAVVAEPGAPFALENLELDEPRDDEVLVRIVAAGVCQTDAHARSGHTPVPTPIVLGHEGAGIVEQVGSSVTDLRPGDHVVLSFHSCGRCAQCLSGHPAYCEQTMRANFSGTRLDGTRGLHRTGPDAEDVFGHFFGQSSFATHTLTNQRNTVKVDEDLPLELVGPLGCGLQTGAGAVLNSFAVPAGETIAIFGVGAVGFGALMAARLAGAATIIAVDVNTDRLALARELGATHTVDAAHTDVSKEIQEITGGGVAYVLDTTGRADMLDHAVDALRPLGRVGLVAGAGPDNTVAAAKLGFGKTITGIIQGDAIPQVMIPRLAAFHKAGQFPIERLVKVYDFADIEDAFADAAGGSTIKPVLRFPDPGSQLEQ